MAKLKNLNTEEKILEAARSIFVKRGLYGARMQDIADEAGINKALLHYYFRSKEKLFDQVFEGALTKYFESMNVFSDTSLPLKERIFRYVDRMIDFYSEYPQMSIFIVKEMSINPELFHLKVHKIKESIDGVKLSQILKRSQQGGEFPNIDPEMFLINLHSLCSYPFIASPIFQAMAKYNHLDIQDPNNLRLKKSVKDFVELKLNNTNNNQ